MLGLFIIYRTNLIVICQWISKWPQQNECQGGGQTGLHSAAGSQSSFGMKSSHSDKQHHQPQQHQQQNGVGYRGVQQQQQVKMSKLYWNTDLTKLNYRSQNKFYYFNRSNRPKS